MNDTRLESAAYDGRTIALHWITAALVVLLWCLGQTIDWFPKDFPRIVARSTHIVLGVALGLVLCHRVQWRIGGGVRLPAAGRGWIAAARNIAHFVLYALVATVVVLGVFNAWVRGDNLFDLFRIPAFDPNNKALRHRVEDLHALAANVLLALAGLHAAVALAHEFVLRDRLLRRMWSRRRDDAGASSQSRA